MYPSFFIIAAKWEVFIPGAAHISKTVHPGSGLSKYEDKQLAYEQNIKKNF